MVQYCLVADLLGFSNLMLNLPPALQAARVHEWTNLVETSAQQAGVSQFQLVSDTVFASAPPTCDGLKGLIAMSQALLSGGVPTALPIRGAIAYGDVTWGNITFGRPIVDAYRLSNEEGWVGVCLHDSCLEQPWSWDSLIAYPVPLKSGAAVIRPAILWDIPPLGDFTKALISRGLGREGEVLTWEWVNKVQNTVLFGMYARLLRPHRHLVAPGEYRGGIPIDLFERLTREELFLTSPDSAGVQQPVYRLTTGCREVECHTRSLPKF